MLQEYTDRRREKNQKKMCVNGEQLCYDWRKDIEERIQK